MATNNQQFSNQQLAPRRPRWLLRIALLLVAVVASLGLVELIIRIYKPLPRVQLVRGYGLTTLDGVPIWEYSNDRHNRACVEEHPERIRVLFFGSSISFGSGLTREDTFTTALQERLNAVRPDPGFCILNFAQAGFSFEQKFALARREVARYRPALIMWEDWVEWMDYALIGDTAYGVFGYRIRPDGFIGIAGVPDDLNRWLLLNSRLYEYLTLTWLGERYATPHEEVLASVFANERLIKVPRLAESLGAKLVMYLAPPLDRPFAEIVETPPVWHQELVKFADANDVPVYPLQRELIEQDYLAVRQDPCCHFNEAGHRALVPIMERIILEQLDGGDGTGPRPPA